MNTRWRLTALLSALLLCSCRSVPKSMTCKVTRLTKPVEVDGNWDKLPWTEITPQGIRHPMGQKPGFAPKTQVKIAYDDAALYLIFRVEDRYVRAVQTQQQTEVSRDSCVEFFFIPGPGVSNDYFYLEMNCIGKMLFRYHGTKTGVVQIPESDYSTMTIAHSLPGKVDPEIAKPVTWTLEYRLPLEILKKVCPIDTPAPGVRWLGNFYKCAEENSHPHWLTWTRVDSPTPNFHLPQYFGVLEFE